MISPATTKDINSINDLCKMKFTAAATTLFLASASAFAPHDAFVNKNIVLSTPQSSSSSMQMAFDSKVFETTEVDFADTKETIVKGGRDLFPLSQLFLWYLQNQPLSSRTL
mmetsp:Transcript_22419/g.23987  ORF Transcript_22419/g.23987 Transcript_22419/m.23987 type:complete len:111 (-) Transcript_22419:209-541(-)